MSPESAAHLPCAAQTRTPTRAPPSNASKPGRIQPYHHACPPPPRTEPCGAWDHAGEISCMISGRQRRNKIVATFIKLPQLPELYKPNFGLIQIDVDFGQNRVRKWR